MEDASYVLLIAKHTGWSERHILWELPLARGLAYEHGALLLMGNEMKWPDRRLHPSGAWWQGVLTRRAERNRLRAN